ncbi:hypothetical protein HMSSN139_41460 [Paenibacillus sp. HMSSN-139]|nr:hypothetical protein HMSSN139_41460 [Paenibacillus sp. HMSSN-139]
MPEAANDRDVAVPELNQMLSRQLRAMALIYGHAVQSRFGKPAIDKENGQPFANLGHLFDQRSVGFG